MRQKHSDEVHYSTTEAKRQASLGHCTIRFGCAQACGSRVKYAFTMTDLRKSYDF
jgi:hypothetical protein